MESRFSRSIEAFLALGFGGNGNYYNEYDNYSSSEEEASEVYDYNYESRSELSFAQSQPDNFSLPEMFQEFLADLETDEQSVFRFSRFRTCNEEDREECAEIFLEAVINRPKIIGPATFVLRTVRANPPDDQEHPRFMDYLHDLIESKINHLLQQSSKWTPLRNIGKFLAILNSKNAITNALMNIWFDGVQSFVSKNNVSATKALLEVLQVTLKEMKTKDSTKFNFYIQELGRISRVAVTRHENVAARIDKTVTEILKDVQVAPPSGPIIQDYGSSDEEEYGAAGYGSQMQYVPPTLPELFEKFLVDLKQTPGQAFNVKLFQTCSEDDRKKCAELALEAVLADPVIIKPLAGAMQSIQCSATPRNTDHLKFSDHLSDLIESRINYLVKQESKWKPLEIIGNFLAQMYNHECIKNDIMNKWFEGVAPFVAQTNVRGTNVYVSVLMSCAEKLKFKNPTKFKFHVLQLQDMQPTVWLSPELKEWKGDFLRTHAEKNVPTTSNATNLQQQQQSTGAIRKTTSQQVPVLVPQMLTPATVPPVTIELPSQLTTVSSNSKLVLTNSAPSMLTLEQKLNKMYGDHDALQILDEIVALKVEMSAKHLRKITNMLAQKIVSRPDIIKSSVDLLVNLPHRSMPPFDPKELKNPLMLSLSDHLFHVQKVENPNEDFFDNVLKFITMLHSEKVIDNGVITEMSEKLAEISKIENKLSPKALKRIQDALKLITDKSATTEPSQSPVNCQASTSAASVAIDTKKKLLDSLLELSIKGIKEIKTIVAQIKGPVNCDEFAAAFYEAAMTTEQFSLYAGIAQAVVRELSAELSSAFNTSIIQFLYASCLPLTPQQMKASKGAENRLKFIGELYNIKWLPIDGLVAVFDKLSESEVLVQLFRTLLNIVALSVAKNGDGEKLVKYRRIYINRQDGYTNSTSDYLTCREVVRMLDDIAALSTKRVAFDADAVKTIIDGLNTKNIAERANKIKSVTGGTAADFEVVVTAVLNKLAECEDDQLISGFCCKLLEVFAESKAQLNEIIVDKCQELLLSKFLQPESVKRLPRAVTVVTFFGALYTTKVLSASFIALCCEIIVESADENKYDCLYMLLLEIGTKLNNQDKEGVSSIFEKFIEIANADGTDAQHAEKLRNLLKLKTSNSSQNSVALLQNLTRSKLISASTSSEIAKLCERSPQDLVTSFYFSVIRNPDKADLYADLCEIIQKHQPAFKDHLKECLRSRVVSVSDLKKQNLDEEARSDLAATTIFIGELYVRSLVDDDLVPFLLKPAKHLSFDSISQLSSVIGGKVIGGDDIRMKALLMNLEEVAQDEQKQFWEDLKRDISEITEVVTRNNEQSSREAEEASEEQA